MIIGINGYSGSGKDTVGKLIQIAACNDLPEGQDIDDILKDYTNNEWWIEEKSGWEIKKWAGKLKTIASLLTGIPVEKFEDQEFKKTNLGPEWNVLLWLTTTVFLQIVLLMDGTVQTGSLQTPAFLMKPRLSRMQVV